MTEKQILSHDFGVYVVHVKPSSIQHVDADFGSFSTQYFSEEETIV